MSLMTTQMIEAGLTSNRSAKTEAALEAARALGDQAEACFAAVWSRMDWYAKSQVTVILGETRGEYGAKLLRDGIRTTGPQSSSVVCPSLYFLALREGPAAADDLYRAYRDLGNSGGGRDQALITLVAVGDGREWDLVFERLSKRLLIKNRRPQFPPDLSMPVCYLLRHGDPDRIAKVRALLRRREANIEPPNSWGMAERDWLNKTWPGLFDTPDQETPADLEALEAWRRRERMLSAIIGRHYPSI